MTQEEKAKAYDEALERARKQKYDYQKEFDKTDKNSQLAGILRVGISAIELVFPELAENEDEKIRKEINILYSDIDTCISELLKARTDKDSEAEGKALFKMEGLMVGTLQDLSCIEDYLEKHKEPIPIPDKFSGLKSLLLQYLQSAANRTDDTEIESDTDLWGRKILDYVWKYSEKQKEQKPSEWSEDDEYLLDETVQHLEELIRIDRERHCGVNVQYYQRDIDWLKDLRPPKDCSGCAKHLEGYISGRGDAENKLLEQFGALITPEDELHIKPRWKPSEKQIKAFKNSVEHIPNAYYDDMWELYEQLKKFT